MPIKHPYLLLCLMLSALSSSTLQAEDGSPNAAEQPPESATSTPQAAAQMPLSRAPLLDRSQTEEQALVQRLEQKQQQQLIAEDDTFLALWLEANAAQPNGVVVLLPGADESADGPKVVGPLRRKLPDAGWHSLSISLPSPLQDSSQLSTATPPTDEAQTPPSISPKSSKTDDSEAADNPSESEQQEAPKPAAVSSASQPVDLEQQRDDYAKRVLARINAAITFAREKKANTVVLLGHGSGAYWAARFIQEHKPAQVQNLISIDATAAENYPQALDELIPALPISTADVVFNNTGSNEPAVKRLQASKRLNQPNYQQIRLKLLLGNPEVDQEQLYRRVKGWLKQHAGAK